MLFQTRALDTRTLDRRERMFSALHNKPEVRSFFEKLVEFKTRGVTGTEVLIPETVIDMINIDMTFTGNIYNLVTTHRIKGDARVILSCEAPTALWLECCGALSEVDLDFRRLEIDCYKVGAVITVCNSILEDSFVDIADYIQQQFVKSILKALDKVILTGDPLAKQPTGIILSLPTENKITSSAKFAELYTHFGELPDDTGDLSAVMTRNTYYNMFAGQMIQPTADGRIVMPQFTSLPDVKSVNFVPKGLIPDNQMLVGDFSKYILVERSDMVIARSKEVKFIEDETVFKVTGRYDGKPIDNKYWLLITLTA